MDGQVHWFPILAMLASGLGIGLLVYVLLHATRHLRRVQRPVECPKDHKLHDAVVVRDPVAHRWTGVLACDALDDPNNVNCDRHCIDVMNAKELTDQNAVEVDRNVD